MQIILFVVADIKTVGGRDAKRFAGTKKNRDVGFRHANLGGDPNPIRRKNFIQVRGADFLALSFATPISDEAKLQRLCMHLQRLNQISIRLNLVSNQFSELTLIHWLAGLLLPISKQGRAIASSSLVYLEQLCLRLNITKLRLDAGMESPIAFDERIVQIK